MKFKRKLSGILAVLMLLSSVSYGAGAAETEAVTENINTAETETTTDTENETDDTPAIKTLEFPVDVSGVEAQTTSTTGYSGACENVKDGVILHAFCWSFDTIKNNMADIAAAGYTAVQTSPPNACNKDNNGNLVLMGFDNTGHEDGYLGCWWWHYQPIDWKIGNYQLGTRQDYIDMCTEAHKYGIKIIADVLPNHTTPEFGAVCDDLVTAVGGTKQYSGDVCTGISNLYHTDGYTNLKDITTKTRYNYIYNASGGLPDVNTENPDFQVYYIKYLNDLVACGCDGLRYDTAKHIGVYSDPKNPDNEAKGLINDFWDVAAGTKPVTNSKGETVQFNKPDNFFIYGEILQDSGIPYDEYSKYMSLVASTYGAILRKRIADTTGTTDGTYLNLDASTMKDWHHNLGGDKLVTWVESHDTYCNDHYDATYSYGKSSYKITNDRIRLGWAVIAAREKGTPLFFSRPAGAGDTDTDIEGVWGNNELGAAGNDEYKCVEVAEVNKFRNAMVGQTETLRNRNSKKMLQIDRGSLGTCIINLDENSYDLDNTTTVADGTYIDSVWHEKHKNDPDFTDKTFVVSNGNITGTLEPCSVAVIYNKSSAVSVSAYSKNNEFTDNTLDVTLLVSGGNTGSYRVTVDGNTTSGSFINGDTITIGNGVNVSDTSKEISLTLSAGGTTKTYTYYKMNPSDYTYVYFDNSLYNWCPPSVYIYNLNGSSNAVWPGEIMTAVPGTNYYKYRVPNNLKDGLVIFYSKSGDNRYPANNDPGLSLGGRTMLFSADHSWTGFEPSTIYDTDNEPELEEPESESNGKKRYIYYFNSLGRTDTINNNTSANIKAKLWKSTVSDSTNATYSPMSWSESLHCYYYEFAESEGYDRVQFNTGSSTSSQEVISEGKVFVPTKSEEIESEEIESGEWISPTDIYEHTIYFDNVAGWTNVKAYLWDGALVNAKHPGEEMTPLGEVVSFGDQLYSYTYYYPRLNGSKKTDYVKVQFNNRPVTNDNDKRQTSDLNVVQPSDTGSTIIVYNNSGTGSSSEKPLSNKGNGNITVTVHYSNTKLNADGTVYSSDTDTSIDITPCRPENAIAVAISQVDEKNGYNCVSGYTSQFEYVKELAKSYGANISPDKFIYQSKYFSGVGEQYSANSQKWVTFKNGNDTLSRNEIKPDLSNLTSIEVYLWAKANTYKVDFIYPTTGDETLTTFNNDTLSFATGATGTMHSQKRYYNEPISANNTAIISDMETPSGKVFDGWYRLDLSGNTVQSYYKVSSFRNYNCRVMSDLRLYAVFRDENTSVTPGATATTGGVDDYLDNGTLKHRFNTILNVYNANLNDTNIKNIGVVYVKYGSDVTDYQISTVKTALTTGENSIISGAGTNGTSSTFTGDTLTGITYDYYTYPITENGVKLNNYNRIQFALSKLDNDNNSDEDVQGNYSNFVAFTTFKYNDTWYISDNYVLYKYNSANGIAATEMPAVN